MESERAHAFLIGTWQEILEDEARDWQESDQMTLEKVKAKIQEWQQDESES